ncbi:CopY family transcriptional regulator [Candidatus Peregrinibacteria bacterium]|nr:MAG: CopY family transcriptional regulator [Candidatus Peregrinibacteria bacterium]
MKKLLGTLEEKIMNILWKSTVALKPREVLEKLEKSSAYTTIMTVMSRLYQKEYLEREKKGNSFYYTAKKSQKDFLSKNVKEVFRNLVETHGNLIISEFVESIKDQKDAMKELETYFNKTK